MSADKTLQLAINTIRSLAIDAIQKANSGHPGTPLDAAPTAYTLWQQVLRYDPDHPNWLNRDRFVLSGGHASMLLYALIHLTGIKAANPSYEKLGGEAVSLDDIKNFRQAGSRCPGHPEYGWTSGVESTTGPLGQGLATSVGMAIAGRWLAETYNRPGYDLFDFNVYSICGDGDMMEGISSEAASVAGHLRLSNLCWIYDSNRVTIEGHTDITFTEDVAARFLTYGWEVIRVTDPNDIEMLERAYRRFLATGDRPTLIVVHSHIGYGAPHKQDSPSAHGEPLGPEEVRLTKEFFGFSPDETFVIPAGVREHFTTTMGARGSRLFEEWEQLFGLIGCGSEVSLCVQTSERLTAEGIKTRVVSMPAWELFDEQDQQYQDSVLPPSVTARVTVEEASPIGWERYAGCDGAVLGMRTFGMSAPMKIVAEHFGFTPDHVAVVAKEVLARCQGRAR